MPRTLEPSALRGVRAPSRPRQFDGPQPGKVTRLVGSSLYVELDAAPGLEIGPVKWARPGAANPPVGTRLLVLFAGTGVADAWVATFSGWPA